MDSLKPGMTFGAQVVPSSPRPSNDDSLRPPHMLDSPVLTPAVSRDDLGAEYGDKPIPPHSPFYQHPPVSFERIHTSNSNSKPYYEKDLESGHATPLTAGAEEENPFTSKVSIDASKECKMWPSRQTLEQQRAMEKKKRRDGKGVWGFGPVRDWWLKHNKKQQLYMKLALALLLVGVAVAIGVGISKAVHGTYSSGHGKQEVGGDE